MFNSDSSEAFFAQNMKHFSFFLFSGSPGLDHSRVSSPLFDSGLHLNGNGNNTVRKIFLVSHSDITLHSDYYARCPVSLRYRKYNHRS